MNNQLCYCFLMHFTLVIQYLKCFVDSNLVLVPKCLCQIFHLVSVLVASNVSCRTVDLQDYSLCEENLQVTVLNTHKS